MAFHGLGDGGGVIGVGLAGGEIGELGEFFRVADDGGDLVAALQGFCEYGGADEAGGADQGDFHGASPR
ncbi:hypothetical protein D3C85_568410 [compost metagenome]